MENISSEQELLELCRDGKITEDEYKQLLEAMRKSPPADFQKQNNIARKYMSWFGFAIIIIIAVAIYLTRNDSNAGVVAQQNGHIEANTIMPNLRVGDYTFGMSKDEVLKRLGKPRAVFYGAERYTLNDLPRTYYMVFGDISFLVIDDLVKEIAAISSFYKFTNGLGVGDSEHEIKQAFGDDFYIRETKWKDFLIYEDQGLVFEVNKDNRMIMEINVTRRIRQVR